MRHTHIADSKGEVIYSTIDPRCRACVKSCDSPNEIVASCGHPGRKRRGIKRLEVGSAFLCSDEEAHIASSKIFKKELAFLAEMALEIAKVREDIVRAEYERTNRLLHNLIKLNALEIQELYSVIPQDQLASTKFRDQLSKVEAIVVDDAKEAASALLRLLKNAVSMRNEFSAYKKLREPLDNLRPATHPIHKVILNVASLFYQTILERDLRISLGESDQHIIFDYDSIQVALYHLLDNACKYAEIGTEIVVNFCVQGDGYEIAFEMESLYIPDEEAESIFEDGVSGAQPLLMKTSGNGVGMGLIRDLLALNYAEFHVERGQPRVPKAKLAPPNVLYAKNRFIIIFPRSTLIEPRRR